jgi:hypothetical protein
MGPVSYYVPSLLKYDVMACFLVRIVIAIVGAGIIVGIGRFSARLNAVMLVCGALFQSGRFSAHYIMSQQVPLIGLFAALVLGLVNVRLTYGQCVASLKKGDGRSPSNAEVTEVLARFDALSHWIAILTPCLGLIMLGIVAMLWR